MIDHIGIAVRDQAVSKAFYARALAPLGIGVVMEVPRTESGLAYDSTGFGADGKPFFWIGEGHIDRPVHLAFVARTRAQVDAFYAAALQAGARDNGPPGIRAHYHPNYYGAFVVDLNGINLEAVCHSPPGD
jgi:catechol 2,3-dioxygenase-like lactoylglutathione lyase family enzyme